jgi:hypothetical protein
MITLLARLLKEAMIMRTIIFTIEWMLSFLQ